MNLSLNQPRCISSWVLFQAQVSIAEKCIAVAACNLFRVRRQVSDEQQPLSFTGASKTAAQGTCFVVMGFGKKTDFETGRVLDLDQSYNNLIKPAVEAAGLKCIRADEIVHSGLIDVPMYELLLKADVVVADLSTSNRNAVYELGVRHALRPYTTVIIAEEQMMKSPFFDLNHIVIRQYRHLGEDIGVSEAKRFTNELTKAIQEITAIEPKLRADSPVYKFIDRLTPPSVAEEVKQAVAAVAESTLKSQLSEPLETPAVSAPAHSELMARVDEAQRNGDWLKAKMLLEEIREMRKAKTVGEGGDEQTLKLEDPYILQRLALATYKSKYPSPRKRSRQRATCSSCSIRRFRTTLKRLVSGARFTSGFGMRLTSAVISTRLFAVMSVVFICATITTTGSTTLFF